MSRRPSVRILDGYLLRHVAARQAAIVTIIVAILAIENTRRLSSILQGTGAPLSLLGRLLCSLLPEYLGIALPLATYLSTALAFRALAIRGEWQMFGVLGVSPARTMVAPMVLAALAGAAQLGVRFEFEPRGERALDGLYSEIRGGVHGLSWPPGEAVSLGGTTLFVEGRPGHPPGQARVFIRRGADVFAAADASTGMDAAGGVVVDLRDGLVLHGSGPGGRQRAIRFARLVLRLGPEGVGPPRQSSDERLDRLGWRELLVAVTKGGEARAPLGRRQAEAVIASRVSSAAFCLLLPWFGLAFGPPPRRRAGGAAILLGVVAFVGFLRTAALVEAHALSTPIAAAVANLAGWIVFAWWVVRYADNGVGAWDEALTRWAWSFAGRFTTRAARERPAASNPRC